VSPGARGFEDSGFAEFFAVEASPFGDTVGEKEETVSWLETGHGIFGIANRATGLTRRRRR
jgi:hypothetical protein